MSEEVLINVTPREVRVALLESTQQERGMLQEIHIERSLQQGLVGNIYKGRVLRLLPGIQAAFVDIGLERSAFLHLSDLIQAEVNSDIRDLLKVGQDLLVQVYKDPLGSKGARLTTQFTIPSRYLVFTPGISQISVSQKITDETERQRLTSLMKSTPEGGYIFRTLAEHLNEAEIYADKQFLDTLWLEVKKKATEAKPGELVYEELPILLRVLRDLVGLKVERIRVDNEKAVQQMRQFAQQYVPNLVDRIEYYSEDRPIFDIYSVEDELQKALYRKVYLKSGGHLVFDQTEAMTTIDVNTGSYLGHGSLEQTIFKTNLEAVDVIARQIRLRNLGGIIIIDFIDMENPEHRDNLIQLLTKALAKDTARTEISEVSSLGLVQMTRKRTRESLEHILCVTCPLCQRRGSIKSIPTVCYEIFREIRRVAQLFSWSGFLVLASQAVVDCLIEEEALTLAELETKLNKPIKLQVESTYSQENYDILPWSEKD